MKDQCFPHVETIQLIRGVNQLTGFNLMRTLVINGHNLKLSILHLCGDPGMYAGIHAAKMSMLMSKSCLPVITKIRAYSS